MHRSVRLLLLSVALSSAGLMSGCCGCNGSCPPPPPDGGGCIGSALEITPNSGMVTTVPTATTSFQFTCQLRDKNGKTTDVSADADWTSLDVSMLRSVQKGNAIVTALLPHGGLVTVSCTYQASDCDQAKTAYAQLAIQYVTPDVLGNNARGGKDWFGGADSQDMPGPTIIYPFDGTMLPRNIGQMNLQWEGDLQDQLYRIHVTGEYIDSTFYVGTAGCKIVGMKQRCQYQPPEAMGTGWKPIALSDPPDTGHSVQIDAWAVAGRDNPVKKSQMPVTVKFSPQNVEGGFYYFFVNMMDQIRGLKRLALGAAKPTYFVRNPDGQHCAGCHTVSRDGKKLAATFEVPGSGEGYGGAVDAKTQFDNKTYLIDPTITTGARPRWNFATYSPDGNYLLTNWNGVLTLRNGITGRPMRDLPILPNLYNDGGTGGPAVMPEWSPAGDRVVFVQLPQEGQLGRDLSNGALQAGDWIVGNTGNIAVMSWNGSTFGQAQVIVPSGIVPETQKKEYHFYPSWSPQGDFILFVTGSLPGSSASAARNLFVTSLPDNIVVSYDWDNTRLRLVDAMTPNAVPIDLVNATHDMLKTSTWPKFAPFSQDNNSLVFFTFSTKFDYGWVVTGGTVPQLWMSAIDLGRARAGGGDPSYPPFWLPFQDPTENNHSGIWTEQITCLRDSDCNPIEGGGFACKNGICQPVGQ